MAAPLVSLEEITLRQGEKTLFTDLSLFITARDRLALIGRNGAGKTTLMKLVSGEIEADRGRRAVPPGTHIVTLSQTPDVEGFATLGDYALAGDDAPPRYAVEAIATQIGIDLGIDAKTSSGGERRRASIARALASEPDLLLLDEPTNHLDLEAISWLEDWLKRFRGAFLVVSHDRMFLTRLTQACLWLDRGSMRRQEVGFGGFEAWTEQVYAEEARAAERLDTKIAQELHWLQRGVTARRKRNEGRLARLGELRSQRQAMLGLQGKAKLALETDDMKAKLVIEARHVGKSFGDGEDAREIIHNFSVRIQRGDRIGIVGRNGAGKTTLLRLLTGDLKPDRGAVVRAHNLSGVMIDQQRRLMDPAKRVRDVLADGGDWIMVRGQKKHLRGYLKEFMFLPDAIDARIGSFSGGEQSRLLLAREFARQSNLLVLDEPTNDLDLETLDLLQEVVADYEGTVLIVSHDRDFLDRTTTMTFGLDGSGKVEVVAGGYRELEAVWASAPQARKEKSARAADARPEEKEEKEAPKPRKLGFRDQYDLETLPGRMEALEEKMAVVAGALSDPELYGRDTGRFQALTAELDRLRAELATLEERWLEVAELQEALART